MFGWLKRRRRKKILATPWPEEWDLHFNRNIRLTWEMTVDELVALKQRVKIFIAETGWEGCDGQEITEEVQVTIAGQACLMLLGVKDYYFDNVKTILVFPRAFEREVDRDGVMGSSYHAGEAWQGGPVILSWRDTLTGGRNEDDGRNLVVHEFAHVLDGLDGEMGGELVFDNNETTDQWNQVVAREYEALCLAKDSGRRTLLDHYGTTNPAEFFAVASETFFEQPWKLEKEHSQLYSLLQKYYRVDPQSWQQKRRRRG